MEDRKTWITISDEEKEMQKMNELVDKWYAEADKSKRYNSCYQPVKACSIETYDGPCFPLALYIVFEGWSRLIYESYDIAKSQHNCPIIHVTKLFERRSDMTTYSHEAFYIDDNLHWVYKIHFERSTVKNGRARYSLFSRQLVSPYREHVDKLIENWNTDTWSSKLYL